MTPDEVIEKLASLGVNITRKTLLRYEQEGLVPKPSFRNSRNTDYPESVVGYAYAAWRIIHDIKFKDKRSIAKAVIVDIANNNEILTPEEIKLVLANNKMLEWIIDKIAFFKTCMDYKIPANKSLITVTMQKDKVLKWFNNKAAILTPGEETTIISGVYNFRSPQKGDAVYLKICDLITAFIVFGQDSPKWEIASFQYLFSNEKVKQEVLAILDYIVASLNNYYSEVDEKTKEDIQNLLALIEKAV